MIDNALTQGNDTEELSVEGPPQVVRAVGLIHILNVLHVDVANSVPEGVIETIHSLIHVIVITEIQCYANVPIYLVKESSETFHTIDEITLIFIDQFK